MQRNRLLVILGLSALSLASSSRLGAEEAAPAKSNIILCMTDDQGWGDVSYNGLLPKAPSPA